MAQGRELLLAFESSTAASADIGEALGSSIAGVVSILWSKIETLYGKRTTSLILVSWSILSEAAP